MKKTIELETKSVSDDALSFIIDYAQKNRGTVSKLTERMSKAMGRECKRQMVEAWIHPDAERRVEPRLGIGLILIAESRGLINGGEVNPLGLVLNVGRKHAKNN